MIESIDLDRCDACGVCLEVCPTDVFRIDEATGKYCIAYRDDCMTCYVCEFECRPAAILVGPQHHPKRQVFEEGLRP